MIAQASRLAAEMGIRRRVLLRVSESAAVPMTWGVWKPILLLPAESGCWSEGTLCAALRHELAHIRHLDAAARALASFVTALYWPNPLAWMAARAWSLQQELAADDLVLGQALDPAAYARQLLDAARALHATSRARYLPVVAMAKEGHLETRLRSILAARCNRQPSGKGAQITLATLAVAMVASLGLCGVRHQSKDERLVALRVTFIEAPTELVAATSLLDRATLSRPELDQLLRGFLPHPEVKVVSYPRMITRSNCRVDFQALQSMPLPENGSKEKAVLKVGTVLKAIPQIQGDHVQIDLEYSHSEIIGATLVDGKSYPVSRTRTLHSWAAPPGGHSAIFSDANADRQGGTELVLILTPEVK